MVAAMDMVGVDGAIFISAFSMYRYDASCAVEVQRAHPGRFALVKPDDPAITDVIADSKTPDAVEAAPRAARVRGWQFMSRGPGPGARRTPPESARVGYSLSNRARRGFGSCPWHGGSPVAILTAKYERLRHLHRRRTGRLSNALADVLRARCVTDQTRRSRQGDHLLDTSSVFFGAVPAVSFTVASPTGRIQTITPPGADTVHVSVVTPGGTSAIQTTEPD
jgi:hypothetical protein